MPLEVFAVGGNREVAAGRALAMVTLHATVLTTAAVIVFNGRYVTG
jgi:hypothetical protein